MRWWRRREPAPAVVEAPVMVWRPPPYVLPVDTEDPADYCGTLAERARWVENSRLRRQHERAESLRVADADAIATNRAGWQLRDQISLLAVEQERVGASADVEATTAAAQRDLDDAAADAQRAWELAEIDHEDALAAARHRGEVADLARRTAMQVAENTANDLLLGPPGEEDGEEDGGNDEEPGEETEGNPQVSDDPPAPRGENKLEDARAYYLHQRRRGITPIAAKVNDWIGSKKYVKGHHIDAWEAELTQERRFRAVGE